MRSGEQFFIAKNYLTKKWLLSDIKKILMWYWSVTFCVIFFPQVEKIFRIWILLYQMSKTKHLFRCFAVRKNAFLLSLWDVWRCENIYYGQKGLFLLQVNDFLWISNEARRKLLVDSIVVMEICSLGWSLLG